MASSGITGTYYHNIDTKGRMNFPAKLREALGESFWIVRGASEDFLSVYSKEKWDDVNDQLNQMTGPSAEGFRRWLNAGACEVTPDKQGRILIPQPLREHAGLDKDVVIVGAGTKAEIWDSSRWTSVDEAFDPKSTGILEALNL